MWRTITDKIKALAVDCFRWFLASVLGIAIVVGIFPYIIYHNYPGQTRRALVRWWYTSF